MNTKTPFIGIDCGSTTVKIVVVDDDFRVLDSLYAYHRGNPYGVIQQYLQQCPYKTFRLVAATSSTPILCWRTTGLKIKSALSMG